MLLEQDMQTPDIVVPCLKLGAQEGVLTAELVNKIVPRPIGLVLDMSRGLSRGVLLLVQHHAPGAVRRLEARSDAALQALAQGLDAHAEDAGGSGQVDAV